MPLLSMDTTGSLEFYVNQGKIDEREDKYISKLIYESVFLLIRNENKNNLYSGKGKLNTSISRKKINVKINIQKKFSLSNFLKTLFFIPTGGLKAFQKPNFEEIKGLCYHVVNSYFESKERAQVLNGEVPLRSPRSLVINSLSNLK